MRPVFLIIIWSLCSLAVMAQSASQANSLFQAADYQAASVEYGKLLKRSPNNTLYLYRYARCAQELGDSQTAIRYFQHTGNQFVLTYFWLGELYMEQWHMDQAIASYQRYLQSADDAQRIATAQERIRQAQKIQKYLRHVQQIELIRQDTLSKGEFLKAYDPYREAGSWEQDSIGRIMFTTPRADRRISVTGQDTMWLVNQYRLLDQWSEADTLPATINFTLHQNYPFMLSDGVTLYFAAQDSNGLGGYDIYITRYNSATEQFTTPENVGFPFNSERNDYLMVMDESKQVGLFASDRHCGDDSVIVYTYHLPGERTYWRNIDEDSLAAYARLHAGVSVSAVSMPLPPAEEEGEMEEMAVEEKTIRWVLNDSTVYTSEDDFLNDSALHTYHLYLEREQEYQQVVQQLHDERLQYMNADADTQQQLTPSILQLENRQGQMQQEILELMQRIIQLETSEYSR